MKHFLLYGHGGSYNHGAEAIVKTTIEIVRDKYNDNAFITLSSHFSEQDKEFSIHADEIISPDYTAWEKEKVAAGIERKKLAVSMYAEALDKITSETTLLSVGGDNFCYPNWHRLKVFQDEAKRKNARSILWSASVEPSAITSEMLDVLSSYDVITARESRTYNALSKCGVKSKLHLIPDVAFGLVSEKINFPKGFESGNFIGINISPLIIRREVSAGIVRKNISQLIDYILEKTNLKIALMPHVVTPADNDYAVLSEIYDLLTDNVKECVWLVSDKYSAAQYKYIISQCKSLICSRTHPSIAAYSSNVPCMVIGYSIKSIGIAEDLDVDDFVLPITDITEPDMIKNRFLSLGSQIIPNSRIIDYIAKTRDYMEII